MKRILALLLALLMLPAAALAEIMYILPESDTRLLTWDEVAAWDYESLGYAFNEIFADLDVRAFSYEDHYIDEIDNLDDYNRVSRQIEEFDAR